MAVRTARVAGSVLLAAATTILLISLAVVPFLNPVWVSFAQDRAEATAWTGYTDQELRTATDAILADLIIGPPTFDTAVAGEPVLNERERDHMVDVRSVFVGFGVLALASALVLTASGLRANDTRTVWRPVRAGAVALAAGVVVVGLFGVFAFELAFEVFHRLFFAGGTYTFDPRTERLVQLFPQRFWFETSLAVGVVILALAGLTAWLAAWRLRSGRRPAVAAGRPSLEAAR